MTFLRLPCNFFSVRLFADDTSSTISGISIGELLLQINLELPSIYNWLCANKLTLSLKKQKKQKNKYIVFKP